MTNIAMKNVKRFQFDVPVSLDDGDYDDLNSTLTVEDLEPRYADAADGDEIAELTLNGDGGHASFKLGLEETDGLIDVLNHIKAKVLATKKQPAETDSEQNGTSN